MSEIVIQRISEAASPSDASLTAWAAHVLKRMATTGELVIRLVDEAESQQLNDQYRGKSKPTNVLSFPAEPLPEFLQQALDVAPLGDLVICSDVVNREAAEQGKTAEAHWAHMVTHGCLHLLGYDHIDDAEAERMEALERELLAELNFSDPYELERDHV